MAKRLFLIDGTALAYRSFFAFQGSGRSPLTTEDGHPTAATYGFCMTLRALIEREQPDAMAISFDGPRGDLLRTKIYPEYKSTRTKMPDEMAMQLDDIRQAVEGYGLQSVSAEEHEADDVIGTLAVRARDAGMDVFIVTGDKDFLQIVDDKIKLWNLRSSTTQPEIFDAVACEAKWGLPPTAIVDMLALMGDSSDNVPGVPKVGKKTAVDLLVQFGTMDGIYEHLDEVKKPSIKKSLDENRELAKLSKQLVTLQLDLDVGVAVEDLGPAVPDPEKLLPLFQRLDFKNLLADLATKAPPQDDVEQKYSVITELADLQALIERLQACEQFAVTAETTGKTLQTRQLVGMAFATAPGEAVYVPLGAANQERLDMLRPLLEAETPKKQVHNLKRLLAALRAPGIKLGGIDLDILLASYCTEPGLRSHSLDDLALKHFAFKKTSAKDLVGTGKKQRTFAEVDPQLVGNYVCEEADLVLRLQPVMQELLERYGTMTLYREMELPLAPILLDMEWTGIAIDREQLA
jgi:DNA polymerase-1